MSHGFDDVGRLFGPDRVLRDWWGPRTVAGYKARSQCLGRYYASFRSGGQHVDGNRTLGEDIADTGFGTVSLFPSFPLPPFSSVVKHPPSLSS